MGDIVDMKPKEINFSQDYLKDIFRYDGKQLLRNNKIAGGLHKSGYRQIKVNNISYPAHRLIWVYHYGSIDSNLDIDHIDGNKDNNSIFNLRLVTRQENCFNRSRLHAKGYSWSKKDKKWHASIWVNNKLKFLGQFINEMDARNAYLNACSQYHIL
jgi:hypothetical protein